MIRKEVVNDGGDECSYPDGGAYRNGTPVTSVRPVDPFCLPPRSVISFSGGRTSGLMLRRVLDAFGGKLPEDRKVIFCNTGKEREETLEFVDRCSRHWDVKITWLEYRWEPGRHYFVEVDYATASRKGEPFEMVIAARGGILPNVMMRFCTAEMKMRTSNRFVRQSLGWAEYFNAIGLRFDEPKRVKKMSQKREVIIEAGLFGDEKKIIRASDALPGESPRFPLSEAGHTLEDVMAFWGEQSFDLELNQDEGNCDLCFLKGVNKILKIVADRPESADWWAAQEAKAAQGRTRNASVERFRMDRPGYQELALIATGKDSGPGWLWADQGNDGSCGELDECRCTD